MIKEKQRFMNAPTNYAVEKSRLMKIKVRFKQPPNFVSIRGLLDIVGREP